MQKQLISEKFIGNDSNLNFSVTSVWSPPKLNGVLVATTTNTILIAPCLLRNIMREQM